MRKGWILFQSLRRDTASQDACTALRLRRDNYARWAETEMLQNAFLSCTWLWSLPCGWIRKRFVVRSFEESDVRLVEELHSCLHALQDGYVPLVAIRCSKTFTRCLGASACTARTLRCGLRLSSGIASFSAAVGSSVADLMRRGSVSESSSCMYADTFTQSTCRQALSHDVPDVVNRYVQHGRWQDSETAPRCSNLRCQNNALWTGSERWRNKLLSCSWFDSWPWVLS